MVLHGNRLRRSPAAKNHIASPHLAQLQLNSSRSARASMQTSLHFRQARTDVFRRMASAQTPTVRGAPICCAGVLSVYLAASSLVHCKAKQVISQVFKCTALMLLTCCVVSFVLFHAVSSAGSVACGRQLPGIHIPATTNTASIRDAMPRQTFCFISRW